MKLKIGDVCLLANKKADIWDQYDDMNVGIIVSDVDRAFGRYVLLNKGKYISYPKNLLRKINED